MSKEHTSNAARGRAIVDPPRIPPGEKQLNAEATQSADWTSDPQNPVNWSSLRKWTIVTLFWATNVVTAISSTAFEPALSSMLHDLGTNDLSIGPLLISIYVIGYCFGPLVIAPASEVWGRVAVVYPSFVVFLASLAVCGTSSSLVSFIIFRAIMGFAGITFLICGRAFIADVIPKERRGLAVSLMTSGPTLGPTLGPVIGGYVAQQVGWRWIFWISLMALGALMLAFIPILRETFPPILLARHQARQRIIEDNPEATPARSSHTFRTAATRPLRFIFRTRLVPIFTLYTSIVNSYLFIQLSTLGTTFESVYAFSPGTSGLAYLGMLVGFLTAVISVGYLSDALLARRASPTPEDRLVLLTFGAALLPGALLLYGWSLQTQLHWMAPVVWSGLVAFATMYSYIPVSIYVIDVYTLHAASATGAMTILRSAISAVVPLAAPPLHAKLGYGWGYTLLAGLALPFVPGAVVLVSWGARIRNADRAVL